MKYKVGDKVRVRKDLQIGTNYGDYMFVSGMDDYKGSVVTISEAFSSVCYIKEDKEKWGWTDEMFETEDELTAEEAIKIQAEMCRSIMCKDCAIDRLRYDSHCECAEYRSKNPDKVLEIIKQWKKDHEKKEIKTEIVNLIKVMKEVCDDETCIYAYEIDMNKEDVDEKMKELVKKYYEEHGGKIYAKYERICRIKS